MANPATSRLRCPTLPSVSLNWFFCFYYLFPFQNLWFFDGFFRDSQGIFGVHYGDPDFLLDIPKPEEAPAPESPKFGRDDFHRPTWINPHHPYLLLLPRRNPFYGPIFSCLDVTPRSLPVERTDRWFFTGHELEMASEERWGLQQSLVDRWLQLESILYLTLNKMINFYVRDGLIAEGVYSFNLPTTHGYTQRNSYTRAQAVATAMRSRDAFLPLMSMITMMFILLDATDTGDWRAALQRATMMPWQWMDDLEASAAGNMDIERMGGIIDLTLTKKHPQHLLPRHIRWLLPHLLGSQRVPLYFFYGNTFPLHTVDQPIPPALQNIGLVPDPAEVAYVRSLPGDKAFSLWSTQEPVWKSL